MKSARADLDVPGKLWAGLVYIGGTHPAAAGGAWKVAVEGFAGISFKNGSISLNPVLPKNWKRLKFKINYRGKIYLIDITPDKNEICEL